MESWALTIIIFWPLLMLLGVLAIPSSNDGAIKKFCIVGSLLPLAIASWMWWDYSLGPQGMQYVIKIPWIPLIGIDYHLGADGLSLPMIFLTALLSTLCYVFSQHITLRVKEYYALFLLLQVGMFGTFSALDYFLFYVFWEISLVPMYFLIGIWGGPRREYAAIKFFLYTLVGSVLMLLAILAMYFNTGANTFDMLVIAEAQPFEGRAVQGLVFWGLFLGFAIKVPVWPFHTWLPDAHVEAPTAGSVILAGVLLKMGCYGFLRIVLPTLPEASADYAYWIAILGLISIIYGAFVAMAQWDFKKLIAYSSVNHMGYVMLGIAAAASISTADVTDRASALNGAMLQMFSHGVITGALFLLVGFIYERTHTRDLHDYGGLGAVMARYSVLLWAACFASLGLPGMSGFVAEFFVFRGAFPAYLLFTCLATIGLVVTAAYLLWTIQRVLLGPTNPKWEKLPDLNRREMVSVVPLMVLTVLFGVYPKPFFTMVNGFAVDLARLFGGH